MSADGLAYTSMFADRPKNNFGIDVLDYIKGNSELRLSENINDYANKYGSYTNINGLVSGRTPSLAAVDAVDVSKAPAVFSEKGLSDWVTKEALNPTNIETTTTTTTTEPGIWDKTTNFLGSDAMKGVGTVAGMGFGLANIFNSMRAQKQAKKQWEAENARADELMAMNKEKYNTYKADKARLNSQY